VLAAAAVVAALAAAAVGAAAAAAAVGAAVGAVTWLQHQCYTLSCGRRRLQLPSALEIA
jgi:hypothetical protein